MKEVIMLISEYLTSKGLEPYHSTSSLDNMRDMAHWLCANGEYIELRLFQLPSMKPYKRKDGEKGYKNTVSVYADRPSIFVKLASALEIIADGRKVLDDDPDKDKQATLCWSLQTINPQIGRERTEATANSADDIVKLAKGQYNQLNKNIKQCRQSDIVGRRHLVIDLDPERPSGTPATESEKDKARQLAVDIIDGLGWPIPLIVDSGNGIHLIYCINEPNDTATRQLIESFYAGLSEKFSTDAVKIDNTLADSARCLKLAGSMNRKGYQPTADRPHRMSCILYMPPEKTVITRDQIQQIATLAPNQHKATRQQSTDLSTDAVKAKIVRERKPSVLPDIESRLGERNVILARIELAKIGTADKGGRHALLKKAATKVCSYVGLTQTALDLLVEWDKGNKPNIGVSEIKRYIDFMLEKYNVKPIGYKAKKLIADHDRIKIVEYSASNLDVAGEPVHNTVADFLGIRTDDNGYQLPAYDIRHNLTYIRKYDSNMKLVDTLHGSDNIAVYNGLHQCCIMCTSELTAYKLYKESPELTILVIADNRRRVDAVTDAFIRQCQKVFICMLDADESQTRALNDFYLFYSDSILIGDLKQGQTVRQIIDEQCKDVTPLFDVVPIEAPATQTPTAHTQVTVGNSIDRNTLEYSQLADAYFNGYVYLKKLVDDNAVTSLTPDIESAINRRIEKIEADFKRVKEPADDIIESRQRFLECVALYVKAKLK